MGSRPARASPCARDRAAAEAAIETILVAGAFGDAGRTVVIEELLAGDEVSLLALCHGQTARPLGAAQDFKRVGDGDTGPEHRRHGRVLAGAVVRRCGDGGGRRGSCTSPCSPSSRTAASRSRAASTPGSCSTADGPRVLEYNVRFGDPETQALVARFDGDLAAALSAIARAHRTRSRSGSAATPR